MGKRKKADRVATAQTGQATQTARPQPALSSVGQQSPLLARALLLLLLLGGLGALVVWASNEAIRRARTLEENQLDLSAVDITPTPPWLQPDYATQRLRAAGLGETLPLAEPDLAERVYHVFADSSWIENVAVTKGYRLLQVDLSFRKPLLAVYWQGQACYVDRGAHVLSLEGANLDGMRRCLVAEIADIDQLPLPAVGKPFADQRLRVACQLADQLQVFKDELGLLVIVIREGNENPRCALRTLRGSYIEWGTLRDAARAEIAKIKIELLRDYVRRHGGLEQPHGPYEFDVSLGRLLKPVALKDKLSRTRPQTPTP